MHSAASYRKTTILSSIENREPIFSSDYYGQWRWEFLFIGRNILRYTFSQVKSILKQGNVKNIDPLKCGKKRWRVLGSMVLADQTKRPLRWTGHDGLDAMWARYVNSLACTWEPDQMCKGQG
jgi:hypothetical protein